MKYIVMFIVVLCTGCSKGDVREYERVEHNCSVESIEKRVDFTLACIANANPKSDEEPEDWIRLCQYMAEATLCPSVTMVITQRCETNVGCIWRTIKKQPKAERGQDIE